MVIYSFVALVVVLTNLENVIGKGFHFSEMKQNDLEEMESWLKDREENWRDTHFTAASDPSTQLVLVIEGVR